MGQREKLFGLTIAPTRLRQIRKERRPLGKYSSMQQVRYELREAEKIFKKYNIPYVDTTEFSIEEISSRILDSKGVERRVRPVRRRTETRYRVDAGPYAIFGACCSITTSSRKR